MRRSKTSGKIRGFSGINQTAQSQKSAAISVLFGGSALPKLKSENFDVRQEKEKALLWIQSESKKYNCSVLKKNLSEQIDEAVTSMKNEQAELVKDDCRHQKQLNKLTEMHSEFVKENGNNNFVDGCDHMTFLRNFDRSRINFKEEKNQSLHQKKEELQKQAIHLKLKKDQIEILQKSIES